MDVKKCSKCEQIKNICEFTKDKNRVDGLFVYCKECKRGSAKKEYEKNKSRILSYQKEYYLQNTIETILRVKRLFGQKG